MFIWYLYSVWWPQFQTRNWVFDLLHCTALLGGVQISLGVVWRPLFFLLYDGCKLCNFDIPRNNDFLKNFSQWICCRYAWWYTRFQSFNEFFPSVFMEKYHVRVCETQKRMNVSIENLAVAFKTILVLFRHLQSRFTSYFNNKNWVVLNRRYEVQTLCKRKSDVGIVCIEQFLPVARFHTRWTSACTSCFHRW